MKKLTWLFGILLALVLVLGGVVLYFFKFKEYDVADDNVNEVLEEGFDLTLPDGTTVTVDKEGNVIEQENQPQPTELVEGATVNEEGKMQLPDGSIVDNSTDLPVGAVINADGTATLTDGSIVDVQTPTTTAKNETTSVDNKNNATTNTPSDEQQQVDQSGGSSTDANNEPSINEDNNGSNGTNGTIENGKSTVSDIKNKYAGSFATLESQANAKLNGLIGTAKSEYSAAKANGESVSYSYYYQKYYGAAQSLESNTDNAFNALLSIVKSDLQKNGYDTSYADSFVTEYNAAKSAREANLLNQVKSQF